MGARYGGNSAQEIIRVGLAYGIFNLRLNHNLCLIHPINLWINEHY